MDPKVGSKPPLIERITRRINLRRGLLFLLVGLVALPVLVLINSVGAESFSITGAVTFVLGGSLLVGVIGIFTDKVPF